MHIVAKSYYGTFKRYQNNNKLWKVKESSASVKQLDFIFFPINFVDHWAFVVVFVYQKKIKLFDSIKNYGRTVNGHCVCDDVRQFLTTTNVISDADEFEWQAEYPETPQQNDGYNCGVYTCQLAKQISRGQQLIINERDIPYLRKEMVVEIVLGHLFQ